MNEPFPDEISDAQWTEARRRAEAIRRFLRSVSDVLDLGRELGVSKATAYRLVKAFRAGGTVTSLVDRKRGRPEGHSVLDDAREEIIRTTINAVFLTPSVLNGDDQYRRRLSSPFAGPLPQFVSSPSRPPPQVSLFSNGL